MYTVLGSMDEFLKRIQPTPTQTSEISTSHTALRTHLKSKFTVVDDFLTGSYRRDTMIRQSRDVDLFLVLDAKLYNGYPGFTGYGSQTNGPANLLDKVKRELQAKYSNTNIGRDGEAVRVSFSHVHIDVVPAFTLAGGGYYIPSAPRNAWITTNPKKHIEAISQINASDNIKYKFVPLAKAIKYWNYSHGYDMRGFFLEMLARKIFATTSAKDLAEAIKKFFDWGIFYVEKNFTIEDPGTTANLMSVFYSSEANRKVVVSRFKTAMTLADAAIAANDKGDNETAIRNWKSLFGAEFPNYG